MMKTIGSPIVGSKIFRKKIESLRNIIFYRTYVIIMLSGRLGPLKPKNPVLDRILATFRTWMVSTTLGTIVVEWGCSRNSTQTPQHLVGLGVADP